MSTQSTSITQNLCLRWVCVFVAVALLCGGRWTIAQESYSGPGVVLLKNDRFQTGIVHPYAGKVRVELDSQSSVTHSTNDIAFIGQDLEAVYQYKVRKYQRLGIGEHFQLTRWCISAGLIDHATEHFLHINRTKPDEPRVKQLGIELREKMLNDSSFREFLGLAPLKKEAPSQEIGARPIQTASGEQTGSDHPLVLHQFTEKVQPILINRCSQSACHGFSSHNRLKLFEPKGKAFARISSENLKSVLQFLTTDQSQNSLLLKKALEAHSLQKAPGIDPTELDHIRTVHNWTVFARNPVVTAFAFQNSMENSTGFSAPGASAATLMPVAPGTSNLRAVPQGFGNNGQNQEFQPPTVSELDRLDDELRKILGEPPRSALGSPNSADPFDPAIFNQQFGRSAPAAPNR